MLYFKNICGKNQDSYIIQKTYLVLRNTYSKFIFKNGIFIKRKASDCRCSRHDWF